VYRNLKQACRQPGLPTLATKLKTLSTQKQCYWTIYTHMHANIHIYARAHTHTHNTFFSSDGMETVSSVNNVLRSCNKTNKMHQFLKFIFGIKLYMFRAVPLSTIRSFSLYTQQWYMSYRFAVCTVKKLLMMDRGTVRNM